MRQRRDVVETTNYSAKAVRLRLMTLFNTYLSGLEDANVTLSQRTLTVVMSAWGSNTFPTHYIIPRTLESLVKQLPLGYKVDIIIGLNNGGGAVQEIIKGVTIDWGDFLEKTTVQVCKELDLPCYRVSVSKPHKEDLDPRVPWLAHFDFSKPYNSKNIRVFLVKQPRFKTNPGKNRMLRDIHNALYKAAISGEYYLDLMLAIDSETLIITAEPNKNPIEQMIEHLLENDDLIAVGSNDKFAVFSHLGEPTNRPLTPQHFVHTCTNILGNNTLPGGNTLGRARYMVAAYVALTKVCPAITMEDFMMSMIFREYCDNIGVDWKRAFKILPYIWHVNRIPPYGPDATEQLMNWYAGVAPITKIFEDSGKDWGYKVPHIEWLLPDVTRPTEYLPKSIADICSPWGSTAHTAQIKNK